VIGNVLSTRKFHVIMIDDCSTVTENILLSASESEAGLEIESKIVNNLKVRHDQYFVNHKTGWLIQYLCHSHWSIFFWFSKFDDVDVSC